MLQNRPKAAANRMLQVLLILVLIGLVVSGCARGYASVATYEGGKVSLNQLNAYLGADKFFNYNEQYDQAAADPGFKEAMLKRYIAFSKLSSTADDKTKQESSKKAKDQLAEIKKSIEKQAAPNNDMNAILKSLTISADDLEKYIALQLNASAVMSKKFPDDKVRAEYDKVLKENKHAYDRITLSHILVAFTDAEGKERKKEDALARAKEVQDKLDKGGDFAALAKEYSDDPGSKEAGGVYAEADPNQWVPEFKKAALELPIDKISDPVETTYGYHVMKVTSRKSLAFDEVKEEIRGGLINTFFGEFMTNDLPKIIKKISIPGVTPSPDPAAAPSVAPTVAPSATPAP
ncbi:MAG TPA: peptidylprolyl isomerase [Bacilli bacterium]